MNYLMYLDRIFINVIIKLPKRSGGRHKPQRNSKESGFVAATSALLFLSNCSLKLMTEKFIAQHTGIAYFLHWILIAGLMKLGHTLMSGYLPITAYALLASVSALIAALIVTIKEESIKRKIRQEQR